MGTKTSNDNIKSNNTTITTSNICISCLPIITFVEFRDLVYVILAIKIVPNSYMNLDILKFMVSFYIHNFEYTILCARK